MHLWRDRIGELIAGDPTGSEDELTWQLIEEMAVTRSRAAAARVRAGGRPQGAPLDPDEPELLPRRRPDHRAGDPVRRPRAEHAGEGAGHEAGRAGDRGDDGGRDQRSTRRSASRSRRRSRSPRPSSAASRAARRPARTSSSMTPVVHDDDRPARRLARGRSPTRDRHAARPRACQLGRASRA